MGGFKESSVFANRPCRICPVKRSEIDSIEQHERACNLRDYASYKVHLSKVVDAELTKQQRTAYSVENGIVRPSAFGSLSYFDLTKCLPHDVMHVFFEGALNLETQLLLHQIVVIDGIIDLDTINSKIGNLKLKSDRKFTKPPKLRLDEIEAHKKLSFSSSQMLCISIVLSLVLSEYVSCSENRYYANYMLLIRTSAALMCYSFTEDDLMILQFDIFCHNTAFVTLYPNKNRDFAAITPKLHSLIHLPQQIRLFGPPRYYWCFRYESKNAPLKKIMRRVCNFHNVPFTMANQTQKLMGLDVRSDGEAGDFYGVLDSNVKIILLKQKKTIPPHCASAMKDANIANAGKYCKFAQSFKISGRIFGTGSVFLRSLPTNEELPNFWRISDIVVADDDEIVVLFEELFTVLFDLDSFSYVLTPLNTFTALHMPCPTFEFNVPLHSFVICNQIHVVPLYYRIW